MLQATAPSWAVLMQRAICSKGTAAAASLSQVLEEAGIPQEHLQLACCGRPLPVIDGHRHFLVHPFLFTLASGAPDAVTLNWENTDYKWATHRWVLCWQTECSIGSDVCHCLDNMSGSVTMSIPKQRPRCNPMSAARIHNSLR
jgi:hypothetical protein